MLFISIPQSDLKTMGRSSRIIDSYDSAINEDEYRIALRVGTKPIPNSNDYDYHFMVQTNTGQWAEKHGIGGDSILHEQGQNPNTIPWTLNERKYYDSEIVYFAITD